MDLEKLRPGNWVEEIDQSGNITSRRLTAEQVKKINAGSNKPEGIQIMDEWLFKFGFDYVPEEFATYAKGSFRLKKKDWTRIYVTDTGEEVELVHALQNLYADLTGNDIETNVPLPNPETKRGFFARLFS